MTDCFALLKQPRRPWLEPEQLKQTFLAMSASAHPDRLHEASGDERRQAQEHFTELNTAYNKLREPKDRLQHLLELELGTRPSQIQQVPAGLMDLFMEIGKICRGADQVLGEKSRTTAPLLQVALFERAQEWTEKLMTLQRTINARQEALTEELRELDASWDNEDRAERAAAFKRLEELSRLFSYFSRWNGQVQERIVQLSM